VTVNHGSYPDDYIRDILRNSRTIAMIGASPNTARPSYFVFKYLLERGYDVIPVNPGQAGKPLLSRRFVATIADIDKPIDMVDVFRASDRIAPIVDEMLALRSRPMVMWLQLGVRNDSAAARAEAAGIKVVMDRCPKIEYGRLSSEIAWMGINSRTLSAKRPPPPVGLQRLSLDRQSLKGGTTAAADNAVMKRD